MAAIWSIPSGRPLYRPYSQGREAAELPVEQITSVELIINLKAARALGPSVPPKLLALAYELADLLQSVTWLTSQ